MEEIRIEGMKILACENQLRLFEVAAMYRNISDFRTGNMIIDNTIERMIPALYKYISNYSNIIGVTEVGEVLDNFSAKVGCPKFIQVYMAANLNFKSTEDIVNFDVYKLVYFNLWPKFLKVLKTSIDSHKNFFTFKFNVPKEVIKGFYNDGQEALQCFKDDVYKMLSVNGFENCIVLDNDDVCTIQIRCK